MIKLNAQASFHLLVIVSLGLPLSAYAGPLSAERSAEPEAVESPFAKPDGSVTSPSLDSANSPTRVTLAQELSYKVKEPDDVIKNRSSVRMEYSKYFLDNFFVQFDGKATAFLKGDHRHEAEGTDTRVSQAYVQTSFQKTSIRAGVQTLSWGESILAPITDEVSPRDNRELFNFNLEELRIGQPMLAVDQFSDLGRWSLFYTPEPAFNKNPAKGTAYFFQPFEFNGRIEGDNGGEYGLSLRKTYESSDITFMAASLIDNDYALRVDTPPLVTRVKHRFSLAGMVFNYKIREFVVRGEFALKSPKAFNNAAMQIVEKDEVDAYMAVDYAASSTLTLSLEAVNQHIVDWTSEIQSAPKDRQTYLLSGRKLLMHDNLSIEVLHFVNQPFRSDLTMLLTSFKWNDNLTLGFNITYPRAYDERSGLFNVRDQKQIAFKVQYQF